MEEQILQIIKENMGKALVDGLCGYNGPLTKLSQKVIDNHQQELFELIDGEFSKLIGGEGFKDAMRKALNEKFAKVLVAKMGGELESRIAKLKADPTSRARITIAIEDAIKSLNL